MKQGFMLANAGMLYMKRTLECPVRKSGSSSQRCAGESTSRVAPWLNCGTEAERAELLRRCAVDGIVSNAVKVVYPEAATYLNADLVFGDEELEELFQRIP